MATNTKLDSLVINYLTQTQYDNAKSAGTLNSNQIYMTPASSSTYTLPTATGSTLGGVKIGSNITVSNGTISISKTNVTNALGYTPPTTDTKYTLPTATSSTLGGVKIGSNITVSSGTISLTKANVTSALGYTPPTTDTKYTLPTASASTFGGVKLSNSIDSTSDVAGGIAATPVAVKTAYDAATELNSIGVDNTLFSSSSSLLKSFSIYKKGHKIFIHLVGNSSATCNSAGIINVGTVGSTYRPPINMTCGVALNVATSGQIFGSAVCEVRTSGEVYILTGAASKTYGNASYPWTTADGITFSWDY